MSLKGARIALRALAANRLRAVLAILGIVVGVAAVIVMMAVGEGAKQDVLRTIRGLGTNILIVTAGQTKNVAGRPLAVGDVTTLDLRDARAVVEECPAVARLAPVQTRRMAVKYGTGTTNTSIVGQTVLSNLGARGRMLGETIRINGAPFEVIGVLEPRGVNYAGVDEDDQVIVPVSTALRRLFNVTYVGGLYLQARDERSMHTAARQVADVLRQRHRLRPGQPDDFTVQTQAEILAAAESTGQTFSLLLAGVAGISLLVGGIGILALMVISVRERTREIGVRRAVGARRRDMRVQFLFEAVTLSGIGCVLGTALGLAGGVALSLATHWPTVVTPWSIGLAIGVSMAIGVFFGAYPATRAARVDPIVALRAE